MKRTKNSPPNGWEVYTNIGKRIPNTRFVPFKVPLKEAICQKVQESFSPKDLLEVQPQLKLIVDLTNTEKGRYYNPDSFTEHGVHIEKIQCRGGPGQVPAENLLQRFYNIVDQFLADNPDDDVLIGVHCTHGLNRTGYFICKYMVNRLGIDSHSAINHFEMARGHVMERHLLRNDILKTKKETNTHFHSPLSNCYDDVGPSSSSRYRGQYLSWRRK